MPKLKFKNFMLDDENTPVHIPMSSTYVTKPKSVTAHGLQNLKNILSSLTVNEPTPTATPRPIVETIEIKKPRKYTRRVKKGTPHVNKFTDIKGKAIAQVVATLDALNCSYKIVSSDNHVFTRGVVFGDSKTKKRKTDRPHGLVAAYFKPYVVGLQIGESATIPHTPEIAAAEIQGSVTGWMSSNWGNGSYTTMIDKERNVQVLRIK